MTGWSRRPERSAAVAFALARTALCAWRAASQSIVHDEALTYNLFVSGSWRHLYTAYNANDHVLFSILAKASVSAFGLSEFTLRLPSVIAGFFLMLGLWLVLERANSAAVRWIAFVAAGLAPLILDFSVAARGYGLAIALLAWAVYAGMQRKHALAGSLLGFAVCANFGAGFAALGVIAAAVLVNADRVRTALRMGIPAALAVLAICGGALRAMKPGMFFAGLPDAGSSLLNLIYTSIRATPHPGVLGTKIGAGALAWGVLPPALIMIAAQSYWVWRYRPKARAQLIPAIALAAAGLGMLTAHRVFGLLYPVDRIGLPIELLAAMAWALAAGSARWKWLIAANVALGGVMAIQFLTQFETGYFQTWWYDASTKKVAQLLRDETRGRPPGSISVGATWIHQPALEFYRNLYRIAALKPVERRQPTLLSGQDYYVLNDPDTKSPAAGNLTTLFSDSFSGIVLARPGVSK